MRMGDDGGGKIKMFQWVSKSFSSKKISKYENANHVSHKLERGCQLGFKGFQRVLQYFCKYENVWHTLCGGKIKGDAKQASHKLERGCQLGFKGFQWILQ